MSLLNSFDIDTNIWEVEPQLKIPKVFAELYNSDKSKGKAYSSKIMWAIALLIDNSEANKFRNYTFEEKKLLISENYLQDPLFDWDKYEHIKNAFEEASTSKLEKSLLIYESKLEERDVLIKNTKYTLDNAADLDKIIKETKNIIELIIKLRDQVKQEKDSGVTKSGMQESASDRGDI